MAEAILTAEHLGKAWSLNEVAKDNSSILGGIYDRVRVLLHPPPAETSRLYWALRDISFSVARGELVGLVGRQGAGKSALLKLISRVIQPSHGRLWLRGRVAAMLGADTDFHMEMTGRENIFMRGAILGMTPREIRHRFDKLVDFAGLGKFLDTPVKFYSLGMTTSLSSAIVTHLDSEFVLIDDVFKYGSGEYRGKCMARLRHDADVKGRAVLFVSHDMAAIRQLCPRVILMDRGRIIADGAADEVIRIYDDSSRVKMPATFTWEVLGC